MGPGIAAGLRDRSVPNDYYQVLGVSPAADQQLIAKAYRLLARRHHPDRGGNASAFQQVEEAYQTLSDSRRRLRYDRSVLSSNGGTHGAGLDIFQILPLRFEQAARGGRVTITRLGPHPRRVEVQVPPGTEDGDRLRVAGQGLPSPAGGPPGNLVLIAASEPHPKFRREGLDLFTDVAVPLEVALRGGKITVHGLEGEWTIDVPPGTTSGDRLRVRAAGIKTTDGRYGDLYGVVQVQIPRNGAPTTAAPNGAAVDTSAIHLRLGERARELGLERDRLEKLAKELQARDQEFEARQQQLIARETAIDAREMSVSQRHERLKSDRAELEKRQETVACREREVSELLERNARETSRLEELEGRLAAEQQRLLAEQRTLQEARSAVAAEIAQLGAERNVLARRERELATAKEALAQAQTECAERQRRADAERVKLGELSQELERRQSQLSASEERSAERRRELDTLATQLKELQRQIAGEQEKLELQRQRTSYEQAVARAEREQIGKLKTELERRERELQEREGRLREQLASLGSNSAELASLRQDLEERRTELSDAQQRLDEQLRQAAAEAARLGELERQLHTEEQAHVARSSELERRRAKLVERTQRLRERQHHARRLRLEFSEAEQRIAAERQALAARARELEVREADLSAKEAQLREMAKAEEERAKAPAKPVPEKLPTVTLHMLDVNGAARTYAVARREVTIGRERPANLRIVQPGVSRMHCRLELWPTGVWLEDLGSRNGTFRNGEKVTRNRLEPGDVIAVNDVQFAVVIDGQPAQVQPPTTHWPPGSHLVEHDSGIRCLDPAGARDTPASATHAAAASETLAGKTVVEMEGKARKKPKVRSARPTQAKAPRFELSRVGNRPALDLTPHHVLCGAGYIDRAGVRHLFVDFVDASLKTHNTWSAEVRYYRHEPRATGWEWVATVARRGGEGEPDSYGAASPHVICAGGQLLLFYAGRWLPRGGQPVQITANPGQPGYLRSAILLATAPVDQDGAPAGPFVKRGPVIEPGPSWDAMRLDYPCVVLDGEHLHAFYTGYDDARNLSHRVVGCATARVADLRFTKHPAPVLVVDGGGQAPRVFRYRGLWHMFYQHLTRGDGRRWRHYCATDPTCWRERDPQFFDPPQEQCGELMLWTDPAGRLPKEPVAWLSAPASNAYQLFEYSLEFKP